MIKMVKCVLIDELASNADLFASFIGKGAENLIKAAAAAKKVGVEFGSIVELGDGLLDITERINKEQTLSTILGKQVSLERFAALNAAGETVAAQEELARILKETQGLTALETRLRMLGGISVRYTKINRIKTRWNRGEELQGMFSILKKEYRTNGYSN